MKRKKSNKFQLLISSAALLLILLVAAGVTYSWIEGGTTYSIITENSNDVKTGTAPVKPIANSLKITPGSTETIVNLNDFDKTTNNTQGLYFSEVSSSDGENFYFPYAYNEYGTAKAYRAANTNDIGTKFIKYDFDVTATKTCYLAFAQTPTITATKDGSAISDTSAFRIMLKCGTEKHILTTADTVQTSNAVTNIDGTTTALTAEPVEKYVYSPDDSVKMFKFNQDETKTIEVSVWLDAEKASPELIGAKVDLNMNLKVDQALVKTKVYVESRGYDTHYGYVYTDNNKKEFNEWPGKLMTYVSKTGYYCVEGELSENAYFIVNNGLNNDQKGAAQYPPNGSDNIKDLVIDISDEKDANGYITYVLKKDDTWHRFDDTEITVNAHSAAFDNGGNKVQTADASMGTVSIDGSTGAVSASKVVYQDTEAGTDVTLTALAGANYEFAGWYSDSGCSDESWLTKELTYTYNANKNDTINQDLYAKFVEKPKHTVAVYAKTYPTGKFADGVGGTVTVNGGDSTVEAYEGSTVTINATANTAENFRFEGWYTDSNCTTKLDGDNYSQAEKTVTVGTEDPQNYYAKFVKQYKVTFKPVLANGTESSDCATLKINNETVSSKIVDFNTEVTLSAEAKGTYVFKKIYKIVDGSNVEVSKTSPTTVTINDDITYFAEFDSKPPVTTTIYFESRNDFTISKAYVFNLDTKNRYTKGWPGDAVSYDNELGLYVYSFETTEEGQFGVLVNDGSDSNQYPAKDHQLVGEIGGTYIFRNQNYTFDSNKNANLEPIKIVNVSVTPKTYPGNLEATAGGTAKASVSKGYSGKEITLTANPNTGFRFAGWYTNEACTDEYKVSDTDNENTSLKVTLGDTDVTYFAKFVKQYSISVIVLTNNEESNAGGNVKIDSSDSPIYVDAGTLFEINKIVATPNSGYTYGGLYAEDRSTQLVVPSVIINDNVIYYAKFNTKEVDCYLLGTLFSNDQWITSDSKKMSSNGDGTYSKTVTLSANTPYEFKVKESNTWYGTDGGTVAINGTYTDFNKTSGNNAKMTTTSAGDYIFTYNQKEHKIKIKAPKSTEVDLPTEDLPTTSKISSNTLIFNFGSNYTVGKIWYWVEGGSGTVRTTTNYSNGTSTVSTYAFSDNTNKPCAIAFKSSETAADGSTSWPGDTNKITGNIINSDSSLSGPYYISDTTKTSWSSFTHLTPSLTVSQTTVNVNSSVTLSASVNGTLNSNAKYTFYVQKDGVTYRASNSKTTSNTCTWTPNVAGTYTVYVAAYDEFGIETVESSPQTVTVN